ncbi:class I adenylate-forming enzyme family protein [Chitiniphilus eburneus]|uniref:Acyl--CoA ligase n=1 Tax=Chitiniphilus eburneus TaxID=2571148 RepID=A0A4U0P5I6_9NEIS|nr:class I adenylate-forming enzyme family protein [Chitiniphilus eburneus]TJZ62549.1 acyl--CoA ligase [Chitiniphilus eburneus]
MNPLTEPTLGAAWARRVCDTPDRTALIFDDRPWRYRDLAVAADGIATTLAGRGVGVGARVILLLDNGPTFIAAFLACQLLGAIPVPASPRGNAERMTYLCHDSGAMLILIEPALAERHRALHSAQPYSALLLEVTAAPDHPPCAVTPADCGECAFIQYTSGSTGHAKGVMISHAAVLENIRAFTERMALGEADVFASLLPLFHDMGLVCFALAPLLLGHPLVLYRQDATSLYAWLTGIGRYGATVTGAPDSLLQIANRVVTDPADYPLHSLRLLICGSEPVRRDSVDTFGARFGIGHAIKPAYGMAELTLCATLTPHDAAYRVDAAGRVASGRAVPGVGIWVRGADGIPTQTPGVTGEILVESPARMLGYWNRPDASAAALSAGRVATGDVGCLDNEGWLYVIGRSKNLLVRGGEKYNPHDIEDAAQGFAAIRRAGVVQQDHGRIVAVLETDRLLLGDAPTLRELAAAIRRAAHARAGIAPDACWFIGAGRIPLTENGKMQHAVLRRLIDSGTLAPVWSDTPLEAADAA